MAEKTPDPPVQHRLKLRNLRLSDYGDIREIMDLVYPNMDGAWTREQFASQIARFPEGQICIEDKGKVVAVDVIPSFFGDYTGAPFTLTTAYQTDSQGVTQFTFLGLGVEGSHTTVLPTATGRLIVRP